MGEGRAVAMSAVDEARALLDHIDRTDDAQAVTDALALLVRLRDEAEAAQTERDALREFYSATMDARDAGVTLTPPYELTPAAVTPEVQRAAAARLRAALDALAAKGEG